MVSWGIRVSCQPPVTLIMSTPAFSNSRAKNLGLLVGQAPFHELIPGHAEDDGKVRSYLPTDFPGNLQAEAHAIFEIPSVFILSAGLRRGRETG